MSRWDTLNKIYLLNMRQVFLHMENFALQNWLCIAGLIIVTLQNWKIDFIHMFLTVRIVRDVSFCIHQTYLPLCAMFKQGMLSTITPTWSKPQIGLVKHHIGHTEEIPFSALNTWLNEQKILSVDNETISYVNLFPCDVVFNLINHWLIIIFDFMNHASGVAGVRLWDNNSP